MNQYTIGEIYRKKLLLNHKGEPYKDKASVSNRLKNQPYTHKTTAFGTAKLFNLEVIEKVNALWND
jgi:hypothetical protein